jgi:hypothetical protein
MRTITTQYLGALRPPAPFAMVGVGVPGTLVALANQAAQVDCAADRTVLPQSLVDQLGLSATGLVQLTGFGGQPTLFPVYRVTIALPQFTPITLEVAAHPDEPWILLGRDVLNLYKVELDGPNLTLSISEVP